MNLRTFSCQTSFEISRLISCLLFMILLAGTGRHKAQASTTITLPEKEFIVFELDRLEVAGATQAPGRQDYAAPKRAGANVTITAVLSPPVVGADLPPGFVTWENGEPGTTPLERLVSTDDPTYVNVSATCGSTTKSVQILVVELEGLEVVGATQVPKTTDYATARRAGANVTITAILKPSASVSYLPPNFVTWANGDPGGTQLEHLVPRDNPDDVTVIATCGPTDKTVRIGVFEVTFAENAGVQKYGFDNYGANAAVPWKSVRIGQADAARANINPGTFPEGIFFFSTNNGNVTVAPIQASAALQSVSVNGVARGDSEIQARTGSVGGGPAGRMNVASYPLILRSVGVRLVHEENDDVQVIAHGVAGAPHAVCVTVGPNGSRDTNPHPKDGLAGDNITTGADGICDTVANNTNVMSTGIPSIDALKDYLNNTVYNQAVVEWVVERLPTMTVNFDLNRDGIFDVSEPWMSSAEMKRVRDLCKDDTFDHNIFLVDNPSDGSLGFMDFNQRYGFVHVDQSGFPNNTVAHELGHGAFGLRHPDEEVPPDNDVDNLMHSDEPDPWRLRRNQWDKINP